jgi:hypothetical protein
MIKLAMPRFLDRLKQTASAEGPSAKAPWWQVHVGAFENDPYFEAAMQKAVKYRKSQPPPADEIDDVSS